MTQPRFEPARVLRRLEAVPEPAMCLAIWRELFDQAPPMTVFAAADAALMAGRARRPGGQVALLSLMQFMESAREQAIRVLLPAATVTGHAELLSLLADGEPARVAAGELPGAPTGDEEREFTLGERRAQARSPDRHVLDRLLLDQDPGVIFQLLQNPKLLERDVLRLVSRRPTGVGVLRAVFRHRKWGRQRVIQGALVQNPYTPLEIGLGLVGLLDQDTLRRVSRDTTLHLVLQEGARGCLRAGAS